MNKEKKKKREKKIISPTTKSIGQPCIGSDSCCTVRYGAELKFCFVLFYRSALVVASPTMTVIVQPGDTVQNENTVLCFVQVNLNVAPKVTMVVQLAEMVQKNKKTGFERRIRMAIKDPSDGG